MNDMDFMDSLLDISDLPGVTEKNVVVYEPLKLVEVDSNPTNRTNDLESDYKSVRQNMHFQQQMILDASKKFLETAKNADSPRHMEVFATLMGQMTIANKELLKLHETMKNITNESTNTGPQQGGMNINNAQVFIGGPTDLMGKVGDAFATSNKDLGLIGDSNEVQ